MLEKLDGQTFDTISLFYSGFDASNPDELRSLFTPEGDVVNSGFNSTSYNNPRVTDLFAQARTVPGCDSAERKVLYDEIQQILHDELPFFYVNTSLVPIVVQSDVANFDPTPLSLSWNIYAWSQELR